MDAATFREYRERVKAESCRYCAMGARLYPNGRSHQDPGYKYPDLDRPNGLVSCTAPTDEEIGERVYAALLELQAKTGSARER